MPSSSGISFSLKNLLIEHPQPTKTFTHAEEPEEVPRKKENTFNRYFSKVYRNLKPREGRFGIEIETEAKSKASYPEGFLKDSYHPVNATPCWEIPMEYWVAVKDGSLRNFGVEFILKDPLSMEDVQKALLEFKEKTKGVKFLSDQVGTSIHVHINVGTESLLFLGNLLTLLLLFENLLVEYSGETRRSNLFALPTKSAEGNLFSMIKMFERLEAGELNCIAHADDNVKYAAINISKLSTFGSIEVRCFRGTTDSNLIEQWVSLLNRIVLTARIPGLTPKGIISEVQRRPMEFFSEVFGSKKHLLQVRDFERLYLSPGISSTLFYARSLASACNFEEIDQKVWESVERRESGKGKISPKIGAYVAKYGGKIEDFGLNAYGHVVMVDSFDCIGVTDRDVQKKEYPYPKEGKTKVLENFEPEGMYEND